MYINSRRIWQVTRIAQNFIPFSSVPIIYSLWPRDVFFATGIFFFLYFADNIYEEVYNEIKALGSGLDIECVGGGRINHNAAGKSINVYGYSQVCVVIIITLIIIIIIVAAAIIDKIIIIIP